MGKLINKRLVKKGSLLRCFSDIELVSKALETGDNKYYGELYARYVDMVCRKCFLMLKNPTIAQDCTQDVMVKAFAKLATFQYKSSFDAFTRGTG